MSSTLTFSVQGTGSSEGDNIDIKGISNAVTGDYNRFVINGGSSDTLTLDMSSPPIPMGSVITAVYIELHSGVLDITLSANGTDKITLNAANGTSVLVIAPVELSYLKIAPTMYSVAEISIMTRQ